MVLVFVKSKLLFMLLLFSPIPSLAELLDVKVAFVLSSKSRSLIDKGSLEPIELISISSGSPME